MASARIEIVTLNGELFLVRDGNIQPVNEGDVLEVLADDANLLVGEGSEAVVIINGELIELGENASLALPETEDAELDVTEQSLTDESIAELLQALETDEDLLELVEEPAAGAEGGEGGDGHSFVRLLRISESLDSADLTAPVAAETTEDEPVIEFGGADAEGAALAADGSEGGAVDSTA
ncbi:MAG: retention module-containing protein, partial [Hydrogenovibrio sp.]|uniref:retention module-containing protein n=1 Tax=Hydrogenovibrio sp. TaxID=2065821 RepID=UPI00286FC0BC